MQCLAVALILIAVMGLAYGEGVYNVAIDAGHPDQLTASLELPASADQPQKLTLRGTAWGLQSQVRGAKCGSAALSPDADGAWTLPAGCRKISWTIVPTKVIDGAVDVSKQASLYFEQGWWLLSEPTSLLRADRDDGASNLAIDNKAGFGAMPLAGGGWRVPSSNNAPEFFVLGNVARRSTNVGGFGVVHVADVAERVERLGLLRAHEEALRYLTSIVPAAAVSPEERTLLVVWIGVDERHGRAGGAAGSRSFVANYVFGAPKTERLNAARTLLVLAHEQFHQLTDLLRGSLPPFPTWLGESLAQYYGLKALAASHSSTASAIYGRFVDPTRPVQQGLLELERRNAAGDHAAYQLFYEQGATFWAEIDKALAASPGSRGGLDPLLAELLLGTPSENGGLPSAFVDKLRQALGARADELLAKYVGR